MHDQQTWAMIALNDDDWWARRKDVMEDVDRMINDM